MQASSHQRINPGRHGKRAGFHGLAHRRALVTAVISAILFCFTFAVKAAGDFKADFEQANQLYDHGKFSDAEKLYDSIVANRHYSPELFYNFGNTEFRLEKYGLAVLNYERALALSPNHPEIKANLAYVRDQSGAKVAPVDWRDRIVADLDINVYSWIAVGAAWVAIFSLAVIFLKFRTDNLWPWLTSFCGLVVFAYTAFAVYHLRQDAAAAIVTSKAIEAHYAPADNSPLAASLPLGSRVVILERRGPWIYCELPDNNRGWVAADAIERIRLRDDANG